LSGTTALPPSHDKTHQPTNPREHLFPRLAWYGASVSPRIWRSKASCGSRQANAPGRGGWLRPRAFAPHGISPARRSAYWPSAVTSADGCTPGRSSVETSW
jgi:hypothetical protein